MGKDKDSQRIILEVATELMSEYGYHGASIQMIAERSRVNKSTIFYYFKSKEGILLSILRNIAPSAINGVKEIYENEKLNGIEKLKKYIEFHLDLVAKNGNLVNLLLLESRHLSEKNKAALIREHQRFSNLVIKIIQEVQRENKDLFKGMDLKIAAFAILGMCNWATRWLKADGKLSVDQIADHFLGIIKVDETVKSQPNNF